MARQTKYVSRVTPRVRRAAQQADQRLEQRLTSQKLLFTPGNVMQLQRTIGNRGVARILGKQYGSTNTVQRFIYLKYDAENDTVIADEDEKRPPGCISGGKQGDHTTPYTVLQNQIFNAIERSGLEEAWKNLQVTFEVYQKLPGWSESKKGHIGPYTEALNKLFSSKHDIDNLQKAVTYMLYLRNGIEYTSLPKGGSGNGEGKWAGSLQYQERKIQLGYSITPYVPDVIGYMWKAFDHSRVDNLESEEKQKAIRKQYAITIIDAYPQLSNVAELTADDLLREYSKQDWYTWKPEKG